MTWDAWLLLARSRTEEAVKTKVSSIRRKLAQLTRSLEEAGRELERLSSSLAKLLRESRELRDAPHILAGEISGGLPALKEREAEVEGLSRALMDLAVRLAAEAEELDRLLDRALLLAKSGEVDSAFNLAIEASNRLSGTEKKAKPLLDRLKALSSELSAQLTTINNLVARIRSDLALLSKAGIELEPGEQLRLVRRCHLGGSRKVVLFITDRRLLLAHPTGPLVAVAPREAVRALCVRKALLGLRRKLILALEGPEGRRELTLICGKKDLKDILRALGPEETSVEAQARGCQPGC